MPSIKLTFLTVLFALVWVGISMDIISFWGNISEAAEMTPVSISEKTVENSNDLDNELFSYISENGVERVD